MLKTSCAAPLAVPFISLLPFQGNLKKYSEEDVRKLAASLDAKGFKTPFYIWHKPMPDSHRCETCFQSALEAPRTCCKDDWHSKQLNYLLDGHRRHMAVQLLSEDAPELLNGDYPAMIIEAETLDEAKDTLLEINSSYGKITGKGLQRFLENAPSINAASLNVRVKLPKVKAPSVKEACFKTLRIRVPKEKAEEIKSVLASMPSIEVL